jgi:hypothetical protein
LYISLNHELKQKSKEHFEELNVELVARAVFANMVENLKATIGRK